MAPIDSATTGLAAGDQSATDRNGDREDERDGGGRFRPFDGPPGPTGGEDRAPSVAPRRPPSLRPALIVLGVALVLILFFGILSAVTGSGGNATRSTPKPAVPTPVAGTSLRAIPATSALGPIEQPGSPPSNITSGLKVPSGATAVSHSTSTATGGTGQYDATVSFTVSAPQETVISFYRTTLAKAGWKVFSVGSARGVKGGIEVLAEKGGTDGWYWEGGVVVSPSTFSGAASTRLTTSFSFRLFQVPDAM
jgi:hypothetical protein